MRKINKKVAVLTAVPVAGALAFGGFALANSNTVSDTSLSSGNGAVNSCPAITATYTTTYDAAAHDFIVNSVKLDNGAGSGATCSTAEYRFVLTGANNNALGAGTYTGSLVDGVKTVDIHLDEVDVSLVKGVTVEQTLNSSDAS